MSAQARRFPSTGSRRLIYGAGVITGILALTELIFLFIPKFQPIIELFELLELYLARINPTFGGIATNRILQFQIALLLMWLASNVAIEAFSRKLDGLSLWQNIASDSCAKAPSGLRRIACTACKWATTVAAAPLLIIWALVLRFYTQTSSVTVGFITIDPAVIIQYVKHLMLGLAAVSSLIALVLSAIILQK